MDKNITNKGLVVIVLLCILLTVAVHAQTSALQKTAETSIGSEQLINDILGGDIKGDKISASNVQITKGDSSSIVHIKENGFLAISHAEDNGRQTSTLYQNIKDGGKLELDKSGKVIGADVVAKEDASFMFGNQQVHVPQDCRVVYANGEIKVSGKEGATFDVDNIAKDSSGKLTVKDSMNKIGILDSDGVTINGNKISGTSFSVGDINVKGFGEGIGTLTATNQGYVLGQMSVADWKNVEINAYRENVLLVNSGVDLSSINGNYVSPGKVLEANGKGFSLNFNPQNQWINTAEDKTLGLDFQGSTKIDITNRESSNQASLFSVSGNPDSVLKIKDTGSAYTYQGLYTAQQSEEATSQFLRDNTEIKPGVPFEFQEVSSVGSGENKDFFISNSGKDFPARYSVTDDFAEYGKKDFIVLMDSEGNVKMPIAMAAQNFDPSEGATLKIYQSANFNPDNYYLDQGSIDYVFKNPSGEQAYLPDITKSESRTNTLIAMLRAKPDDSLLAAEMSKVISPNGFDSEEFLSNQQSKSGLDARYLLPGGGISADPRYAIPSIDNYLNYRGYQQAYEQYHQAISEYGNAQSIYEELLRSSGSNPELQKQVIDNVGLTVFRTDSQALMENAVKSISTPENFGDFLSKATSFDPKESPGTNLYRLTPNEVQDWKRIYGSYWSFDEIYPEYSGIFSEEDKLTLAINGKGYEDLVATQAENLLAKSNDLITDAKTQKAFVFGHSPSQYDGASSEMVYDMNSLKKIYEPENIFYSDPLKDGYSAKTQFLDNLRNPSIEDPMTQGIEGPLKKPNIDNPMFYLVGHGDALNVYTGLTSEGEDVVVSKDDMVDALVNRYIDSASNPQDRSFGKMSIVIDSCQSGTFGREMLYGLKQRLQQDLGVDTTNVKFPTVITSTQLGKLGYSGLLPEMANQMQENGGQLTYGGAIKTKEALLNQGSENPSVIYGYH